MWSSVFLTRSAPGDHPKDAVPTELVQPALLVPLLAHGDENRVGDPDQPEGPPRGVLVGPHDQGDLASSCVHLERDLPAVQLERPLAVDVRRQRSRSRARRRPRTRTLAGARSRPACPRASSRSWTAACSPIGRCAVRRRSGPGLRAVRSLHGCPWGSICFRASCTLHSSGSWSRVGTKGGWWPQRAQGRASAGPWDPAAAARRVCGEASAVEVAARQRRPATGRQRPDARSRLPPYGQHVAGNGHSGSTRAAGASRLAPCPLRRMSRLREQVLAWGRGGGAARRLAGSEASGFDVRRPPASGPVVRLRRQTDVTAVQA